MTESDKVFCEPFPYKDYMYKLWQQWDEEEKQCVFIMLNPANTEDKGLENNATVKNCRTIAKEEKCGGMILLDLFSYISRGGADLGQIKDSNPELDIIGPEHKKYVKSVLEEPNILIVMAWGENPKNRTPDLKRIIGFYKQLEWMEGMIRKYAPNAEIMQLGKRIEGVVGGRMFHPSEFGYLDKNKNYYELNPYEYKYS